MRQARPTLSGLPRTAVAAGPGARWPCLYPGCGARARAAPGQNATGSAAHRQQARLPPRERVTDSRHCPTPRYNAAAAAPQRAGHHSTTTDERYNPGATRTDSMATAGGRKPGKAGRRPGRYLPGRRAAAGGVRGAGGRCASASAKPGVRKPGRLVKSGASVRPGPSGASARQGRSQSGQTRPGTSVRRVRHRVRPFSAMNSASFSRRRRKPVESMRASPP